uniref:Uncharacterized protein n=1 Tax=Strongyloides venezuelensis TaxID=75913 RepID=A0A0K0G2E5_STRVS
MLTADILAMKKINNMKGFNGRFGCTFCYVKGEMMAGMEKKRKMVFDNSKFYEQRTCESYEKSLESLRMNMGKTKENSFCSMMGLTTMHRLYPYSTAKFFRDDMIRLRDGFIKNDLRTNNRIKQTGFSDEQKNFFNKDIKFINLPSEFKRKVKKLEEQEIMEAIEMKYMFLFFYPTILMEFGYVGRMKELTSDDLSCEQIELAKECLDCWFERRKMILGSVEMTMKAHLVTHFYHIIGRFGNICSYSCFFGKGFMYMLADYNIAYKLMENEGCEGNKNYEGYKYYKPYERYTVDKSNEVRKEIYDMISGYVNDGNNFTKLRSILINSYLIIAIYTGKLTENCFVIFEDSDGFYSGIVLGILKDSKSINDGQENVNLIVWRINSSRIVLSMLPANSLVSCMTSVMKTKFLNKYFNFEKNVELSRKFTDIDGKCVTPLEGDDAKA